MLTRGQAVCIILDLIPSEENRKAAKMILTESPFEVVFLYGTNPMEPIAMGKAKVAKDPFKYKKYNDTPPTTPRLSPLETEDEEIDIDDEQNSQSTQKGSDDYSKEAILNIVKSIFYRNEPANTMLYQYGFYTNKQIYEEVKERLLRLESVCTQYQFAQWLSKETDDFGKLGNKRVDRSVKQGRPLWLFNEGVRDDLREVDALFKKHVQESTNHDFVGYVRKSPSKTETDETRARLLNLMITKLQKRCFYEKIHASFSSSSAAQIIQRDYEGEDVKLNLTDCAGSTQDMLAFIAASTKPIALCIIDYAGLTNSPDDLYNTLKVYTAIKEIAVIHEYNIEIISRYNFLHDKSGNTIKNFKSRTGCEKRF